MNPARKISPDADVSELSQEMERLLEFIEMHTPQQIKLCANFKPFIPDYIPTIGDIDAFVKVARLLTIQVPDPSKEDFLGLTDLDEPCANQSDPAVLDLQLRANAKQKISIQQVIRSIDGSEHVQIAAWISNMTQHNERVSHPAASYINPSPDIERLMQVWSEEIEAYLNEPVSSSFLL